MVCRTKDIEEKAEISRGADDPDITQLCDMLWGVTYTVRIALPQTNTIDCPGFLPVVPSELAHKPIIQSSGQRLGSAQESAMPT